jgi:hypothetical protein
MYTAFALPILVADKRLVCRGAHMYTLYHHLQPYYATTIRLVDATYYGTTVGISLSVGLYR